MAFLEKVLLVPRADGTFETIYFSESGMLSGESEDQFIQRSIDSLKLQKPAYNGKQFIPHTKTQLKQAFKTGHKRKMKWDGVSVKHDPNHKTDEEKMNEAKAAVKQKLVTGKPLTSDEADLLLGGAA